MVTGNGVLGQFWHGALEQEFQRFQDRVKFVWLDDLSFVDLVRRCASLPRNSAISHDMDARQVKGHRASVFEPCVTSGDQVLLQQVLVNLVMNAMDAMAATPPARRHLRISSEVRATDVD